MLENDQKWKSCCYIFNFIFTFTNLNFNGKHEWDHFMKTAEAYLI